MVAALGTPSTVFSRDIVDRFVCNTFEEMQTSADPSRPDSRPFDVIVIGGGSFGPVCAQHLFAISRAHRTLVLEGGPLALPEHGQNVPLLGLNQLEATTITALRRDGQFGPDKPRREVWGLPWLGDRWGAQPHVVDAVRRPLHAAPDQHRRLGAGRAAATQHHHLQPLPLRRGRHPGRLPRPVAHQRDRLRVTPLRGRRPLLRRHGAAGRARGIPR